MNLTYFVLTQKQTKNIEGMLKLSFESRVEQRDNTETLRGGET
jgi:hypothetical protein